MKKENKKYLVAGICTLLAFILWTAAVTVFDVQPIGPRESSVGFASLNRFFHSLTDVNMILYNATDLLSIVPLGFVVGFATVGLVQWIDRKRLGLVDRSLLILGGFYAVVIAAFLLFEVIVINYRPIEISGQLEASYPSSTTMLMLCVMPTVAPELCLHIKKSPKRWLAACCNVFAVVIVIMRLLSGVHWLTDIIGGVLLSIGLLLLYRFFLTAENNRN